LQVLDEAVKKLARVKHCCIRGRKEVLIDCHQMRDRSVSLGVGQQERPMPISKMFVGWFQL
jgi:hypothetical protein